MAENDESGEMEDLGAEAKKGRKQQTTTRDELS